MTTLIANKDGLLPVRAFGRKRDAIEYLEQAQREHGGVWEHENLERGSHYVVQKKTAQQKKDEDERRSAQYMLSNEADWFESKSFGGAYRERDRLKERIDTFTTKFAINPHYELRWATDLLVDVACYKLLCEVIAEHESGTDDKTICEHLENELHRSIKHNSLSRSTSAMSNLMEEADKIALAKYAGTLRSHVNARAKAAGILAVL
jgi:hypothetical protein